MKKRGQVTIFIILAIVIAVALLIIFYPRIKILVTPATPSSYVQDCVNKDLDSFITKISEQGGSSEPENFILYKDNKVEYLCYTSEYYKTCVMQQPLLKQHVEQEIANFLKSRAETCLQELKDNYESKGYSVTRKQGNLTVEIVPKSIKIIIDMPVTLTKESSQTFDKFVIARNSELYSILIISQSILSYEAVYGDSIPEDFMLLYPDLRIEKLKQSDGSKIYIVTNADSKEKFIFASRSLSWPEGYGTGEKIVK